MFGTQVLSPFTPCTYRKNCKSVIRTLIITEEITGNVEVNRDFEEMFMNHNNLVHLTNLSINYLTSRIHALLISKPIQDCPAVSKLLRAIIFVITSENIYNVILFRNSKFSSIHLTIMAHIISLVRKSSPTNYGNFDKHLPALTFALLVHSLLIVLEGNLPSSKINLISFSNNFIDGSGDKTNLKADSIFELRKEETLKHFPLNKGNNFVVSTIDVLLLLKTMGPNFINGSLKFDSTEFKPSTSKSSADIKLFNLTCGILHTLFTDLLVDLHNAEDQQTPSALTSLVLSLFNSVRIVNIKKEPNFNSITSNSDFIDNITDQEISLSVKFLLSTNPNINSLPSLMNLILYNKDKSSPSGDTIQSWIADTLAVLRDKNLYNSLLSFVSIINDNFALELLQGLKSNVTNIEAIVKDGNYKRVTHSRLTYFVQPGGKIRYIALVDWLSQSVLFGLHRMILSILRFVNQDGTFDHAVAAQDIFAEAQKKGFLASIDLTAATDRLPVKLQTRVLAELFRQLNIGGGNHLELAQLWEKILTDRDFIVTPQVENIDSVRYSVGQPMGALSSWAMLAFTHHVIVLTATLRSNGNLDILNNSFTYKIVGDDLAITDKRVFSEYNFIMDNLKVKLSPQKTFFSEGNQLNGEFAKRYMIKGVQINPVSIGLVNSILLGKNPSFASLTTFVLSRSDLDPFSFASLLSLFTSKHLFTNQLLKYSLVLVKLYPDFVSDHMPALSNNLPRSFVQPIIDLHFTEDDIRLVGRLRPLTKNADDLMKPLKSDPLESFLKSSSTFIINPLLYGKLKAANRLFMGLINDNSGSDVGTLSNFLFALQVDLWSRKGIQDFDPFWYLPIRNDIITSRWSIITQSLPSDVDADLIVEQASVAITESIMKDLGIASGSNIP